MAYDPTLPDAKNRVRFALGDTGDAALLPGGEAGYTSLLTAFGDDEARVYRAAARALANAYGHIPQSVGGGGESVSWGDRAAHWRKIAAGLVAYPFGADGSGAPFSDGGASALEPVW